MPQLRAQQLGVQHVGPVDLTVPPGQIVCLSGASGSGKSLILRALADLIPHEGHVFLDEIDAQQISPSVWRRQVGYLPAESQWWLETVADHFKQRNDELLGELGFDSRAWQWPVARLSSGEKQRLGLVRLLMNKPECLLLDEPTASLDQVNTLRVEAVVKHYATVQQAAVIWVSHNVEQINRMTTQHWHLQEGRLHRDG